MALPSVRLHTEANQRVTVLHGAHRGGVCVVFDLHFQTARGEQSCRR